MANITVGKFEYNPATGELWGPAEYMREQGNARLQRILSGDDAVFNSCASYSPTVETAVLVMLQTDYAGWLGARQAQAWCNVRHPDPADRPY